MLRGKKSEHGKFSYDAKIVLFGTSTIHQNLIFQPKIPMDWQSPGIYYVDDNINMINVRSFIYDRGIHTIWRFS